MLRWGKHVEGEYLNFSYAVAKRNSALISVANEAKRQRQAKSRSQDIVVLYVAFVVAKRNSTLMISVAEGDRRRRP